MELVAVFGVICKTRTRMKTNLLSHLSLEVKPLPRPRCNLYLSRMPIPGLINARRDIDILPTFQRHFHLVLAFSTNGMSRLADLVPESQVCWFPTSRYSHRQHDGKLPCRIFHNSSSHPSHVLIVCKATPHYSHRLLVSLRQPCPQKRGREKARTGNLNRINRTTSEWRNPIQRALPQRQRRPRDIQHEWNVGINRRGAKLQNSYRGR